MEYSSEKYIGNQRNRGNSFDPCEQNRSHKISIFKELVPIKLRVKSENIIEQVKELDPDNTQVISLPEGEYKGNFFEGEICGQGKIFTRDK